jgi:hypothetical protein
MSKHAVFFRQPLGVQNNDPVEGNISHGEMRISSLSIWQLPMVSLCALAMD